jgi:hypothetical protein
MRRAAHREEKAVCPARPARPHHRLAPRRFSSSAKKGRLQGAAASAPPSTPREKARSLHPPAPTRKRREVDPAVRGASQLRGKLKTLAKMISKEPGGEAACAPQAAEQEEGWRLFGGFVRQVAETVRGLERSLRRLSAESGVAGQKYARRFEEAARARRKRAEKTRQDRPGAWASSPARAGREKEAAATAARIGGRLRGGIKTLWELKEDLAAAPEAAPALSGQAARLYAQYRQRVEEISSALEKAVGALQRPQHPPAPPTRAWRPPAWAQSLPAAPSTG